MNSSRIVKVALASVFAIGLAVAGIGWRGQETPRPQAPERVYCNLDQLLIRHPAWDQYVQLHGLPSDLRSAGDSVCLGGAHCDVDASVSPTASEPQGPGRDALKARLDQRTGEELASIDSALQVALADRLRERRSELVARANALLADDMRGAEQSLTADLRMLDESQVYDCLDSQIKLAALKAQMKVPGVGSERIKSAITAREQTIADTKARLARDEDALRKAAVAKVSAVQSQRLTQIDVELAALKVTESAHIDERVMQSRSRLNRDLNSDLMSGFASRLLMRTQTVGAGLGAGARADQVVSAARAEYRDAVRTAAGETSVRDGMRRRMTAELRAVVTRIARENGMQVVFTRESGTKDSTTWFGNRLPYGSLRRAAG